MQQGTSQSTVTKWTHVQKHRKFVSDVNNADLERVSKQKTGDQESKRFKKESDSLMKVNM